MTRSAALNQTTALQILEGYFGEGNVRKLNHWKFAIRHYYFYRHGATAEGFAAKVQKELAGVQEYTILDSTDTFQTWPDLSYFEVTIQIGDAARFFEGPAPVEEAAAPEVLPEPAATPEPVSNLFNLPTTFTDRKAWRKAIRNLAAHLNAEYTNENGCYYLVLEDGTYEFSLTEDFQALVILLPATTKVL